MTWEKIDGNLDAILRQRARADEVRTMLQDSSQRVSNSVDNGLSASAGNWANMLGTRKADLYGVVNNKIAPAYQDHSDGFAAGHGIYADADDAAERESSQVTFSFGIENKI